VDGDREALRPPERLRGSVHTSARRRVTTASAIVSSVARLASAFASRETEADGQGNDESRKMTAGSEPIKVLWQHRVPNDTRSWCWWKAARGL